MFKVFIEERALKELGKLEVKVKNLILKRLVILERGLSPALDIKKLKGWEGHYRLGVGKFRVLFYLEDDKIVVYRIARREKVYQ